MKKVKLKQDTIESVPLFFNFINMIKKSPRSSFERDYELLKSDKYNDFADIQNPNKRVSQIIDYNKIKK